MSLFKNIIKTAIKDVAKELPKSNTSSKSNTTSGKLDINAEYDRLQNIIDNYNATSDGVYKVGLIRSSENPGIALTGVNEIINDEIIIPDIVTKVTNFGNWSKHTNPIKLKIHPNTKLTSVKEMFSKSVFNTLDVSEFDTNLLPTLRNLFMGAKITNLVGLEKFDLTKHTDLTQMFFSSKIENYDGINQWDVSNIENFTFIFRDIKTLTLDISNWNFNKIITTMNSKNSFGKSVGLFQGAEINNFGDINNWSINKTTNLVAWFNNAKIKSLNLSNWDVSNVESFAFLFEGFTGELLGLDDWNTSKATNFIKLFRSTKLSNNINLSNWKTSKVKNMNGMFKFGTLNDQDLSSWDTSSVVDMSEMFANCKMNTVGDLSKWNASKVENSSFMFSQSTFETVGNVGSWNICNADVTQMFGRCKLTNIGSVNGWRNNKHQEHMMQGSSIK